MVDIHKIIIIGSGPAGLTAALYAARADLKPLVLMGKEPGGQLMTTTDVENFPGFPEGIQGPELMDRFRKQAERFGATMVQEDVVAVDFSGSGVAGKPHVVKTGSQEFRGEAVIVATGASAMWLGIASETRLRGKGVSSCATCDGAFFRGKEVVVVGGGDTAMEEAVFLTKFASKVTVVHRRDALRASKIMQERAKKNAKIGFVWNSEVVEVLGEKTVSGVRLKNIQIGATTDFVCQGLFLAIGHRPNTEVFKAKLQLDKKGYLIPEGETASGVDGVFIAGDVSDIRYRQAVTAAGSGCKAAMDAERWLEERE